MPRASGLGEPSASVAGPSPKNTFRPEPANTFAVPPPDAAESVIVVYETLPSIVTTLAMLMDAFVIEISKTGSPSLAPKLTARSRPSSVTTSSTAPPVVLIRISPLPLAETPAPDASRCPDR